MLLEPNGLTQLGGCPLSISSKAGFVSFHGISPLACQQMPLVSDKPKLTPKQMSRGTGKAAPYRHETHDSAGLHPIQKSRHHWNYKHPIKMTLAGWHFSKRLKQAGVHSTWCNWCNHLLNRIEKVFLWNRLLCNHQTIQDLSISLGKSIGRTLFELFSALASLRARIDSHMVPSDVLGIRNSLKHKNLAGDDLRRHRKTEAMTVACCFEGFPSANGREEGNAIPCLSKC